MTYKARDYKLTWGAVEITSGWSDLEFLTVPQPTGKDLDILAEIPVQRELNFCEYNDCGWCYYKGDKPTTDNNGECNNPQGCEVNV